MTNIDLVWRVEQALGVRLEAVTSLPVGFGLAGIAGTLRDGRKVAVKAGTGRNHPDLTLEAFMLEALRRQSELPVLRSISPRPTSSSWRSWRMTGAP